MKKITLLSTVGAVIATSGCLFLVNGVAAAASISHTGPGSYNRIMSHYMTSTSIRNQNYISVNNQNHQVAYSGAAYVIGNTGSGGNGGYGNNNHPSYCHNTYGQGHSNTYSTYKKPSYKPSHYSSYSNYKPHMDNDYDQDDHYPSSGGSGYGSGGNSYGGSGGYSGNNNYSGSATTGDASNYNSTHATVAVHNNTPSYGSQPSYSMNSGEYGGSQIYDTGPHSYNAIDTQTHNSFQETNVNDIRVSNSNDQYARSGDAIVYGNTHGGSATTGDASNYNSTNLNVDVENN